MASEMMDGFIAGKMDSGGGNGCCMPMMPMMPYGYGMPWGMGMGMMGGYGMGGMWDWIPLLLIFALLGNNGGFGFGGGNAATQADLAAGFANSNVLAGLNDIKLGQANATNYTNQGFAGINTALMSGFHGVDNAICNLGYQTQQGFNGLGAQLAQCCCDTRAAIKDVNTGIERAGWNLSKQISDCCCDLEKMDLNNKFAAQTYNCNTLQAIDKLGDRILGYLTNKEAQDLRDEVQGYRLAASQARQNRELINELRPCPVPAYITCNPYAASYGFGGYNNGGCGCGCGCAA